MIKDNQELYSAVRVLIKDLESSGQKEWAGKLKEAMGISTVPGEILGEIRFHLRALQKQANQNGKLSELLSYLDAIL